MRPAERLVALTLCLLLAACGSPSADPTPPPEGAPSPTDPAGSPAPIGESEPDGAGADEPEGDEPEGDAATAETAGACGEVEQPQRQAGSHLIGDTEPPVPYSSTPPTSGWHASGALEVTVQDEDDPLTEPEQVSVLEAGGVVVSYRELPEEDVEALAELIRSEYDGRVALTPYEALEPGTLAMTAWGTLQRCAALDMDVVESFLDEHAAEDVDPGH